MSAAVFEPKAAAALASLGLSTAHDRLDQVAQQAAAGQWSYSLFTEARGVAPGVAGIWVTRMPMASEIALRIAGAVGMEAGSPTPLAP